MLRPIAIILFLLCISNAFADRIVYTYDASGNRTSSREIVFRGQGSEDNDSEPRRDNLSLRRVTIYPNPTEGELRVEITGDDTFEGSSITIYGASGSIVYYDNEIGSINDIDLTQYPRGIYMMIIRIDGDTSSWKIIKI